MEITVHMVPLSSFKLLPEGKWRAFCKAWVKEVGTEGRMCEECAEINERQTVKGIAAS